MSVNGLFVVRALLPHYRYCGQTLAYQGNVCGVVAAMLKLGLLDFHALDVAYGSELISVDIQGKLLRLCLNVDGRAIPLSASGFLSVWSLVPLLFDA
jgi:hypothetical protein